MPDQSGYWGTTKPPSGVPIDPGHPLAQGLVAYWPCGEGSAWVDDIWGGFDLTTVTTGTPISGIGAHGGAALKVKGSPDQAYSYPVSDKFGGLTAATQSIWVYRAATTDLMTWGWANAGDRGYYMIWYSDAQVYWVLSNGGGNGVATSPLAGIGWHHICMTFDGAQAGNAKVVGYVDGIPQTLSWGIGPAASLPSVADLSNIAIGYDFHDNLYGVGQAEDYAVWRRTLNPVEVQSLYTQPYAMFAPPVWRRYFIPTAVVTTKERRTSSPLGARVGSRQAAG